MSNVLVRGIGELITLAPLAESGRVNHVQEKDLGRLAGAWLLVEDGVVKSYGQGEPPRLSGVEEVDAAGGLVLPSLVDSHTHPLFAGDRSDEWAAQLEGVSYSDIAAKGGGIQRTVAATRAAASADLKQLALERLQRLQAFGVGCVEVKSGYGLSVAEELRHLEILAALQAEIPLHLELTCLALHSWPQDGGDYIGEVVRDLVPALPELGVKWVDAFVELGYFSVADCEPYVAAAKSHGLKLRVHADEFAESGAALAAARWGAGSADHLQQADPAGIAAMAEAGVVATLLPGTSLYSKLPFTQAEPFSRAGCGIAIASDYNPGSCGFYNLPLLAGLAALHCGLSVAQAIAGITYVPARSLDLVGRGSLCPGFSGDFIMHPSPSIEAYLADMGQRLPLGIWLKGSRVSTFL